MKVVLDFDEVLFKTKKMKEHFTRVLEKRGVDPRMTELMYMKHRETGIPFSLKRFLWAVAVRTEIREVTGKEVYEEILSACKQFVNQELVEAVKPLGKKNIIILTNGDKEYQMEKIHRSVGEDFAGEIIVVTGSKREPLRTICDTYKNEHIIFAEDQVRFFDDIDTEGVTNLTAILFGPSGTYNVKDAIEQASHTKHNKKS